jgi:tyrosine-protein kinase Etk/Wzc
MAVIDNSSAPDSELELGALVGLLKDNRWFVAVVVAVFLIVGVSYAVFSAPVYQADAVVQVEQKVPQLPGLSALTQTLGASSSEATTEIALITSRTVVGTAVDNLNLTVEVAPHHFPLIGGYLSRRFELGDAESVAQPKFGLRRYDWGGSELRMSQLEVPRQALDKELTVRVTGKDTFSLLDNDDREVLQGKVGIAVAGNGYKIQVLELKANQGAMFSVTKHPKLEVVTQLQQDINASEQGKDSGIIQLTFAHTDAPIASAVLDQVSETYVRQNVDRNSAEAAHSLAFVKEQLPNVRRELEAATSALNAYQTKAHSVDLTLQTKGLLDQEVALESSLQQLRMQEADMQRRFTGEHPAYKALQQQLGDLRGQKAALEKQVGNLPDTQQELLRLTRDVQVSNQTYTGLLNQAQQLDIARAGTVGNVRIIDKASVDMSHPVRPRKAITILGSALAGLILAVAFIVVRQLLNRGIEDPALIEQLGLPVYASIPLSQDEKEHSLRGRGQSGGRRLLVLDSPADLAAESMRSLRTSLHFARLEATNNLLMISGASPGAGKTFVSANLAAVIAQGGQRVLLIDGDMRKGALHQVLGGGATRGLSDLVAGRLTLDEVVRPIEGLDSYHFIPRGKAPPNPSELLMNERFTDLLERVKPLYDLVIIDTPPILAVTDASIIGRHASTSLLVVRFGLNQTREIALAKQRFEQGGVMIKGAIFNAVERRSMGYYSYGYYEYKTA